MIRVLSRPTLALDNFMLARFEALMTPTFQALHRQVFSALVPGKNAVNRLERGIRWGVFARDSFIWLDRPTYHLSVDHNPQEKGRVRQFVLISEEYLRSPEIESVLRGVHAQWHFPQSTTERAFEIQLSAIRYAPRLEQPALPSPLEPHQDLVDGAIVVMAKTENQAGGTSRLYTLAGQARFEVDLEVGDALFIRDAAWKHQVSPILLTPGPTWRPDDEVFRDVLLVRFQPLGR
jgi:hypothetical protein